MKVEEEYVLLQRIESSDRLNDIGERPINMHLRLSTDDQMDDTWQQERVGSKRKILCGEERFGME